MLDSGVCTVIEIPVIWHPQDLKVSDYSDDLHAGADACAQLPITHFSDLQQCQRKGPLRKFLLLQQGDTFVACQIIRS